MKPRTPDGSIPSPSANKKNWKTMIEEELMAIKEQNSRIERMLRTLIGESKPDVDPRRFMNIPEAAAATGLSIVTLRGYCNRGQIRHTKMGRRVIYTPTASTSTSPRMPARPSGSGRKSKGD